ncbi:MAG: tRNA (guanosine(46)-N7)-methyltransferase TrmB [Pedosphaera sp.]|nr:tRNA (guanosine(46)-N7)-methyltransferase TrmB [Pedosphaera sp.]
MSDNALLHDFQSITEPLCFEELFPAVQPAELEIGCGDGGFLFQMAQQHPGRNFLGVERLLGRIRKLSKKGQRASLTNLRLLRLEGRYVMKYLLPEKAFEAIHVYFPDPWPKDRHARHRLVDEEFTQNAALLLKRGGVVHLRTDDATYFKQMQTVFGSHGGYVEENTPAELAARVTEFEVEFNSQGKPTNRASWRVNIAN